MFIQCKWLLHINISWYVIPYLSYSFCPFMILNNAISLKESTNIAHTAYSSHQCLYLLHSSPLMSSMMPLHALFFGFKWSSEKLCNAKLYAKRFMDKIQWTKRSRQDTNSSTEQSKHESAMTLLKCYMSNYCPISLLHEWL